MSREGVQLDEEILGVVSLHGQEVYIVRVPRMTGYRFDAADKDSLPLAVELAVLQTQKGIPFIEKKFGIGR